MNIAVFMYAQNSPEGFDVSIPHNKRWAENRGHDFVLKTSPLNSDVSPLWNKMLWVNELLARYDAVFSIDVDAIFIGKNPLNEFVTGGICTSDIDAGAGVPTLGNTMFSATRSVRDWMSSMTDEVDADLSTGDSKIFQAWMKREGSPDLTLVPRHILRAFFFYKYGQKITNITDETCVVHWAGGLRRPGWVEWMERLSENGFAHGMAEQ